MVVRCPSCSVYISNPKRGCPHCSYILIKGKLDAQKKVMKSNFSQEFQVTCSLIIISFFAVIIILRDLNIAFVASAGTALSLIIVITLFKLCLFLNRLLKKLLVIFNNVNLIRKLFY